MIIDYPSHNSHHTCFDDVVALVAKKENRDYRLMLSRAWRFQIDPSEALIGNSLKCSFINNFELLKEVHGIEVKYNIDLFSLKDLRDYNYIGVNINTFNCPWDKNYHIYHNYDHSIIINRIDFKNKIVYIIDPFYGKYNQPMSFELFEKSFCSAFSFKIHKKKITDNNFLFKALLNDLDITLNEINRIVLLKEHIIYINIEKEKTDLFNVWHCPIIINLNKIFLNRLRYSMVLDYLLKICNLSVGIYIEELVQISIKWNILRNIIVKLLSCYKYTYLDDAINILSFIIEKEKQICCNIKNIIKKGIDYGI